jgi:membrane fusion protein (multidrug efflux system)
LINSRTSRAAILALAIAFAIGCGKHKDADDEAKSTSTAVPEVTVTKVRRGTLVQNRSVSGTVTAPPNQDAKVAALVAGRIAKVFVTEGDRVQTGQELAQLESTQFRDQVRQAEAAVSQARANVENATLAAKRNEDLLARGIAARKEVEDARTQRAVHESTLKSAEAALSAAHTQLSRTVIVAPFTGTVVKRFLSVGEQVDGTSAQPVVEVANIDALELMGTVPASSLNQIKTGVAFKFTTSSVPGQEFTARVVSVFPAVDPATNNGTVRIRIDNPQHLMKFGMYISVELPLQQKGTSLIVPIQAVYPDESGEPHIYKVTGDEAVSVPVKLGARSQTDVEILEGVQEGDTIILTGGYGLPEKSKVRVK